MSDWWTVTMASGVELAVLGPYRNELGEVYALRPSEQLAWAQDNGGWMPTTAEMDLIMAQADVLVLPVARDPVTAALDSLNADVNEALAIYGSPTVRIAAGKTWLDINTIYGWGVLSSDVNAGGIYTDPNGAEIQTYPSTQYTVRIIQPASTFHGGTDEVDYSDLGYCVRAA